MTFEFSQHLTEFNVPLSTFLRSRPFTHVAVGAYIYSSKEGEKTVLLLQRSESDSYPLHWEGPGGACEEDDESMLSGAAREITEETGLHVRRFEDVISLDEWEDVKHGAARRFCKIVFLARVCEDSHQGWEEERVLLDPKEHRAFVWATEADVQGDRYKFIGVQRETCLRGFNMNNRCI
ncbi:hypothetical protein ASPZODRAFT_17995 [Penicilliopsis zonata CBS 506.65]|uniref:Nudix hydrolase domain-containing protein n=1 Tax=Penicilliopsis zonata CBS 506.65 TaxID=1073090 RepID=A0A1L9SDB5_9EURO|nr:hypothetical protein ASPZODRAFT_17995 [Penicilliopsis zonata CBS 506.65]OJJ45084.1 hypothetical protein ASPZODRAFT_17995 [Penicilliopsis zonata CBS 506.65]